MTRVCVNVELSLLYFSFLVCGCQSDVAETPKERLCQLSSGLVSAGSIQLNERFDSFALGDEALKLLLRDFAEFHVAGSQTKFLPNWTLSFQAGSSAVFIEMDISENRCVIDFANERFVGSLSADTVSKLTQGMQSLSGNH